jgi:hypothetical protein
MNLGSAVMMPEVFLKAVSVARNLGHKLREFTTVNLDMIQHYRPRANVLSRPKGKAIAITGHHEILLPLVRAGVVAALGGPRDPSMNNRLVEIVGRLGAPRVFVLGDLILDKYVWGSVSPDFARGAGARREREGRGVPARRRVERRHQPRGAGRPRLLRRHRGEGRGGRAAPQAAPGAGRRLRGAPRRRQAHAPQDPHARPPPADAAGRPGARRSHPAPHAAKLLAAALRQAARADLAIISDYSKGTLPPELCQKFIRRAACPVLVGPQGPRPPQVLEGGGASLNRSELRALTLEDDVDRGARKLMKELRSGSSSSPWARRACA